MQNSRTVIQLENKTINNHLFWMLFPQNVFKTLSLSDQIQKITISYLLEIVKSITLSFINQWNSLMIIEILQLDNFTAKEIAYLFEINYLLKLFIYFLLFLFYILLFLYNLNRHFVLFYPLSLLLTASQDYEIFIYLNVILLYANQIYLICHLRCHLNLRKSVVSQE